MNCAARNILCSVALLCSVGTQAQESAVSADEARKGFISQYVSHDNQPSLDTYDVVLFGKSDATFSSDNGSGNILVSEPSVSRFNKKLLPKSVYLIRYDKAAGNDMLYWVSFKDANDAKSQSLRQSLVKRYGTQVIDGTEVVPAKWFTGDARILESPSVEGNRILTDRLHTLSISEGIVQNVGDGKKVSKRSSLVSDVWYVLNGSDVAIHGPNNTADMKQKALNLLARDVNRVCVKQRGVDPAEYTIMLYEDADRKAHLDVLVPETLSEGDNARIASLKKAIESQPAGMIGSRYDIDGRQYSACYLKAANDGRGWHFSAFE